MSNVRDANPPQLVAQALSQHPLAQQASSALRRWQSNAEHSTRTMHGARLPPRVVVLPRCNLPLAAVIPGDGVAEQVLTTGLSNFLNLYNTALICRLVLTWFPNPPAFIEQPLSTLCDPYLNLFRGLIPPIGGSLDFSPILAFVVLNLFTSTAAAWLPPRPPRPAPCSGCSRRATSACGQDACAQSACAAPQRTHSTPPAPSLRSQRSPPPGGCSCCVDGSVKLAGSGPQVHHPL